MQKLSSDDYAYSATTEPYIGTRVITVITLVHVATGATKVFRSVHGDVESLMLFMNTLTDSQCEQFLFATKKTGKKKKDDK